MFEEGTKWACHDYPETLCPDHPVRLIAHGLRAGKHWAVMVAAQSMAQRVPEGSTLVPIPSSDGSCYANLTLAYAICQLKPGLRVAEALGGRKRQSQYQAKKAGAPLMAHELAMFAKGGVQAAGAVVLIDNVLDSGETYRAACMALKSAPPILVWAMSPQSSPPPRLARIGSGLGGRMPRSSARAAAGHDDSAMAISA